jgi:hypothetical protein
MCLRPQQVDGESYIRTERNLWCNALIFDAVYAVTIARFLNGRSTQVICNILWKLAILIRPWRCVLQPWILKCLKPSEETKFPNVGRNIWRKSCFRVRNWTPRGEVSTPVTWCEYFCCFKWSELQLYRLIASKLRAHEFEIYNCSVLVIISKSRHCDLETVNRFILLIIYSSLCLLLLSLCF